MRFDNNFERLNSLVAAGVIDKRLSVDLRFDVFFGSLFVGGYNHMDIYVGGSAYLRFVILTSRKLCRDRVVKLSLRGRSSVLRKFKLPLRTLTLNRRRFFWFLRRKCWLFITKWSFFDFPIIFNKLASSIYYFLVKFRNNYLELQSGVTLGSVQYSRVSPIFSYGGGVLCFSLMAYPIAKLKRSLIISEGVIPFGRTFVNLLQYGVPFFAFKSTSDWGESLYDCIKVAHLESAFQIIVPGQLGLLSDVGGVYALLRAFL